MESLFQLWFSKEYVFVSCAQGPLGVVNLPTAVHINFTPDKVSFQLDLRLSLALSIEGLEALKKFFLWDQSIAVCVNGFEGLGQVVNLRLRRKLKDHVLQGGLLQVRLDLKHLV